MGQPRQASIDELTRTTRDEPNYDTLMNYRLEILDREGLMGDLQECSPTWGRSTEPASFSTGCATTTR